jgi:Peptidase A4 family
VTRPTAYASTNWSGAVLTAHSGESFSTVSAEWQIPPVKQVPIGSVTTSDISQWVGIDGFNSSDVCQAGVMEVVHTAANGQQTVTCSAWDEWYPANSQSIAASSFHVKPGDTVSVAVETGGAGATEATFIFHDETTGKSFETSLAAPSGTHLIGNSAEVVVETPEWISGNTVSQPLLSDFVGSPIAFHDISAGYSNGAAASVASAQSIGMWTDQIPAADGSYAQEAYGIVHPNSDSVTVIEDAYWTNASLYASAMLSQNYHF